ncbi:peptidoglycan recognition protein family protein [Alkalicoccus chagannorensis]|uniref:peptidoglycan recognition protein family protein n=1 Tax=Alkalicoccus chagannorensis TaxID=427072 RepID=UPI0004259035|nr:N-acetylmuramoyl-L-alanine amidase [Alkalicoccus chagannorensis]
MKINNMIGRLPVGKRLYRKTTNVRMVTLHHSATKRGNAAAFAAYHVDHLGWPGIGYHYVIRRDGTVEVCWDDWTISYHTKNRNTGNIGICLVGSGSFTVSQKASALDLAAEKCAVHRLSEQAFQGHRDHPGQQTACPGVHARSWRRELFPTLRKGGSNLRVRALQERLLHAGSVLPLYGADGVFGKETEQAVRSFQQQASAAVDGVVGKETWPLLIRASIRF